MIRSLHPSDFDKVFAIIKQSLPIDEYRPYEAQRALLDDPAYRIYAEEDDRGKIIAFIAVWELSSCVFVEHLACVKEYRNKGLGSRLLKYIREKYDTLVCLEVEPPESAINIRRIGFYERNGFTWNPYSYMQPSLSAGQSPVPLLIMTSGRPISEAEFVNLRDTLYRRVYRCI